MKRLTAIIFALVLFVLFCINVMAVSDNSYIPQEVMTVAQNKLPFIKSKLKSDPVKWGFETAEEVEALELGQGYSLKYLCAQDTKMVTSVDDLVSTNITVENWEFTLDLEGSPKLFMTVGYEDGECKVIGYGGSTSAKLFGETKQYILNSANSKDVSISNELAVYKNEKYFLVNENDNEYVVPMVNEESNSKVTLMKENSVDFISASEFNDLLKADSENPSGAGRGTSILLSDEDNDKLFQTVLIIGGISLVFLIGFSAWVILRKTNKS